MRHLRLLVDEKPVGEVQGSLFAPLVANNVDTIHTCTRSNLESSSASLLSILQFVMETILQINLLPPLLPVASVVSDSSNSSILPSPAKYNPQ